MTKYKITYSEENFHSIELHDGEILINNNVIAVDYSFIKEDEIHFITADNKSITAKIIDADYENKILKIRIGSRDYELKISEELDLLMEKMGLTKMKSDKISDVKAPMPGLVLKINVAVGEEVKKGDTLIILEAMKMENIIKANGSGVVKSIHISQKEAVEKNQLLISFE